jgi:2-polyprenyl-3-methyl-5-hydroxy-6-metoxy-1,4-benzoquinol methylase
MTLMAELPKAARNRIAHARKMSTTVDTFDEILHVAMEQGGHVPGGHFPRLFEYPWVLHQILRMKNAERIADIGTGISPLPLVLAKRGMHVYTFDNSQLKLTWDVPTKWSTWGYLDYSHRSANIKSYNKYFSAQLVPDIKYDVIYSVSVVEHMPRSARINIWSEAAKALSKNGRMVFTIDLERYSNNIWNRCQGRIVEPYGIHGKISDVYQELQDAGFVVEMQEVLRGLPLSRVDLLLFTARRGTRTMEQKVTDFLKYLVSGIRSSYPH